MGSEMCIRDSCCEHHALEGNDDMSGGERTRLAMLDPGAKQADWFVECDKGLQRVSSMPIFGRMLGACAADPLLLRTRPAGAFLSIIFVAYE